jgi:hypothetical protein
MIRAALVALLLLTGCAKTQVAAPARVAVPQRWAAVLVAGDGSLPVFDNATGAMADLLTRAGVAEQDIHRFSASPDILAQPHVQVATRARVLDTVATLHPQPGQACLVFITSHGAHGEGVYLAPRTEFLPPEDLDTALKAGCGSAPTVAIVSACYTGDFAQPPVAQANRIVLTASAADRPSFGCGAGRQLTYYDQCVLGSLGSLPHDWHEVVADTDRCVTRMEAQEHTAPSDPQSSIGRSVAGLPVAGG